MPDLMPAIFLGHGNPMNAITQNPYTAGWRAIGTAVPRPRAVLAIKFGCRHRDFQDYRSWWAKQR